MIVSWSAFHSLQIPFLYALLTSTQLIDSQTQVELAPSTCPSRSINYITHGLPQQCLATTRVTPTPRHGEFDEILENSSVEPTSQAQQVGPADQEPDLSETTVPNDLSSRSSSSSPTVSEQHTQSVRKLVENDVAGIADTLEEESALESGNFLSFEEWKRRNLKKQIARRNQGDSQGPRKRPASVQNSLESLGDDGEIDIDFSGFVPGVSQHSAREVTQPVSDHPFDAEEGDSSGPSGFLTRSKDAGTTCKERFNYASFDCAANVLKTNKEANSAITVLLENKDSYMLNQCTAPNKFIILELCNDIAIDTIVLANFEFFSSTFRTFRVSVSDFYPVKLEKWRTLGTYEARNTREVQAFLVENPLIWARYVRIEFLTHYGSEFYCPVSLIRVHGTTAMEELRRSELAKQDREDNDHAAQYDGPVVDSLIADAKVEPLQALTIEQKRDASEELIRVTSSGQQSLDCAEALQSQNASRAVPASVVAFEAIMSVIEPSDTCVPADSPSATSSRSRPSPASSARILDASTSLRSTGVETVANVSVSESMSTTKAITTSGSMTSDWKKNATNSFTSKPTSASDPPSVISKSSSSSSSIVTSSVGGFDSKKEQSSTSVVEKSKTSDPATQSQKDKPSTSTSDRNKSGATSTQAQPATPTMQESFFKSVQKRLHMLEANSSLSLQYIEDQSRALRDAFKKVEQRQLTKTTAFLDQLNQTVLNELRDFRQQYDQLWQSTVIELELQRERYERDNEAINARLGILADEVIFQRRMSILQMVLILVCLVLVLFSRGAINNYLELPIVQNVLARSPSSKWLNLSGAESSSRPPQPPRTRSAHQLRNGILKGHRRMQSEDSITDTQSGTEVYAPPTPISDYGQSEVELSREDSKSPLFESDKDDIRFEDPEFDPNTIERPSTSPPVLRVNGMSSISDILEASEEEAIQANLGNKSNSIPFAESSLDMVAEGMPLGKHLSWDLPNG